MTSNVGALGSATPGRLADKVAIITGSSSGLGRAIALSYTREGACIVCADLSPDARLEIQHETEMTTLELLHKAGSQEKSIFVKADVSSAKDMEDLVEQAVAQFGRLDMFVASCSYLEPDPGLLLISSL